MNISRRNHDASAPRHPAGYHARRAAAYFGAAAALGVIETQNTDKLSIVCGAASITALAANAVHHTIQSASASRNKDTSSTTYPQFQYNDSGFSDRYCAEVEYLASRLTGRLDEAGISELSVTDIDPFTRLYHSDQLAVISKEMFDTRLKEGYELSLNQMCVGLYGAAQVLDSLAVR